MPYSIGYNSELAIIEEIFTDLITAEEIHREMLESIQLAKQHDCYKHFTDLTNATLQLSISEVYKIPGAYDQAGGLRPIWVAIIPPASDQGREMTEFFETVSLNRGWTIKLVSTKEQAIRWLTDPACEEDSS